MTSIDIVADLRSASPEVAADVVGRWAAENPGGQLIHRAVFAVPAPAACGPLPTNWQVVQDPRTGLWDAALAAAGREGRAALALLGSVQPAVEAAGVMLDLLEVDPMFGAAMARMQCERGCCVQTISGAQDADLEWMPHGGIADLSEHELVADLLSPCAILKPVLLTDFGEADMPFESLAGTLWHRLISARRCGFRTLLANRALVRMTGADCTRPSARLVSASPADNKRLRAFGPEIDRGWREFRGASTGLFERLTCRHLRAASGACRPSLLLDMRGVGATYNGTAFAAIGAAWGLHRAATDWDVAILADAAGAAFHEFGSAFPGWSVYSSRPPSSFNVALRLSQPWHIQEMIDLHQAARITACLMLDTIAWDVLYVAPPQLDGTWSFLASTADGLVFISDFTRRRFRARFPAAARTPDAVCHLSFDPNDYVRPELIGAPQEDYFLVIGNRLDHKDVAATVELLASAFPLIRIEALGPSAVRSPRIRTHASGSIAELDVHRLYAQARLVVFPSFYEGFGFPVVTALAYGRPLLARQCSLLEEVAAKCQPRGRLIPYRQRDELVDRIGRLLRGEVVPECPVGSALNGGHPRSWCDVGEDLGKYLHTLMAKASTPAWRAREQLVAQVLACKT